MFLNPRSDLFIFQFPSNFVQPSIAEKYNTYLKQFPRVQDTIIDVLNENIQGITMPSFQYDPIQQNKIRNPGYVGSQESYVSNESVQNVIDKTFTVTIRHIDGYLSYFAMLEVFFGAYNFTEQTPNSGHFGTFNVRTLSVDGYAMYTFKMHRMIMSGLDQLSLTFGKMDRSFQTFDVTFRYSEFDTEFTIPDLNTIQR